jgi:hypothetical protein
MISMLFTKVQVGVSVCTKKLEYTKVSYQTSSWQEIIVDKNI